MQGRAPLLSASEKTRVRKNIFLVNVDGHEVGGGFFYAPGKAVTADHNIPASHRDGNYVTIHTAEDAAQMKIGMRCDKYDYALLECDEAEHSDHLAVRHLQRDFAYDLRGALLTIRVFQTHFAYKVRNELVDFGSQLDFGLFPAYGCKLSKNGRHLLYDVSSWGGDSGTGLVFLQGEVVGMHVQVADTLLEQLDRDQLGDQQMADVAESLAAAAASTPQAKVALLCHVFAK